MIYTAEVTTTPAQNDWSVHLNTLDTVPGTILLQDSEKPLLIFPVEAEEPMAAAKFVDGVCKLTGIEIVSVTVYQMPDLDVDVEDEDVTDGDGSVSETQVVAAVRGWMNEGTDIRSRIGEGGSILV